MPIGAEMPSVFRREHVTRTLWLVCIVSLLCLLLVPCAALADEAQEGQRSPEVTLPVVEESEPVAQDSASRLPKTGDDMTAGLVPYLCAAGIAALVAGLRKSRLHHH